MFEKIDSINNKKIGKLEKKIQNAQGTIDKLKGKMDIELELEEYAAISTKINAYSEYIAKCQEEIEYIKENQYTEEEVRAVAKEIQKEYNPKLKQALITTVNAVNNLINKYEEYLKVNSEFIAVREKFNEECRSAGATGNLYSGDEPIVNDSNMRLQYVVNNARQIIRDMEIK